MTDYTETVLRLVRRWPAEAQEEWDERVAIKQYDAGKTEAQAVAEAFEEVGNRVDAGLFGRKR